MNIKRIEKIALAFEEVRALDAQIIEIEKFAMLIANEETETSFDFKLRDLTKKQESNSLENDEDDFLSLYKRIAYIPTFGSSSNTKKDEKSLKVNLTPKSSLLILGVLLGELQEKRKNLINSLERISQ